MSEAMREKAGRAMSVRERRRFYERELLRYAPVFLSGLDRCPVSASSGSADREYWAWATKDFSNMDLQRGLLVPAYLYAVDFPGNEYHARPALLQWVERGVRFWIAGQDRSGAFNHMYPYESSWMAAAFTLVDLLETYKLLREEVPKDLGRDWLAAMERCCRCLLTRDETHGFISNHRLAAAAGLMGMAGLTGKARYRARATELANEISRRQSPEGWLLEYEGFDPGYQTLALHYLALYQDASGLGAVPGEEAQKALAVSAYFIHPDNSVGGEYGSRNCPHFFPGGFETFAAASPVAEALVSHGVAGLADGSSCGLADADVRNQVPMATSYVYAHRYAVAGGDRDAAELPWRRTFERFWPEAGLYVRSDNRAYWIFGGSKGGVVKCYAKEDGKLLFSSCGYEGSTASGKELSTLRWTTTPAMRIPGLNPGGERPVSDRTVSLSAPFYRFHSKRLMTPYRGLLFRLFVLSIGRIRLCNELFRKYVIQLFITRRDGSDCLLDRSLAFAGDGETVLSDQVTLGAVPPLESLREHASFVTMYMASARYFRRQELFQAWSSENLAGAFSDGALSRTRTVVFPDGQRDGEA
ncbi:hypothetical protein GM415_04210 [Pseudodesulfovibrio cashew]|uniref:Heparin-sulfate lyase N-terminal domain-containing protein n=1 Tax=Pseudodesulfovibrio cashew TaxID=2678688 RepID=A0A6I6J9N1_9BACT|nr:hypothetical protein [Pseudodesulfovibrio cashew]QGY39355.1 hypothetical protein GM415_04210 [Pseudodesulfovibrio cashew]